MYQIKMNTDNKDVKCDGILHSSAACCCLFSRLDFFTCSLSALLRSNFEDWLSSQPHEQSSLISHRSFSYNGHPVQRSSAARDQALHARADVDLFHGLQIDLGAQEARGWAQGAGQGGRERGGERAHEQEVVQR